VHFFFEAFERALCRIDEQLQLRLVVALPFMIWLRSQVLTQAPLPIVAAVVLRIAQVRLVAPALLAARAPEANHVHHEIGHVANWPMHCAGVRARRFEPNTTLASKINACHSAYQRCNVSCSVSPL